MSKIRTSAIAAALAAAATGMVYAQSAPGGQGTGSPGPVQAPETDNRDPGAPAGTAGRQGPGTTQQSDTMTGQGTTQGTMGSGMDDPSLSAADRARIEAEEQRLGRDLTPSERDRLLSERPARADRN